MPAVATAVEAERLAELSSRLAPLRSVTWDSFGPSCMEELRAAYGGRCRRCGRRRSGRGRPLEFAHVRPTGVCGMGRGQRVRFFDVLRNPECYELLCKACHRRMDGRKWTAAVRSF